MDIRKWIRKNTKTMILLVMALLLVAFLLGDVIQYMGGNSRTVNTTLGRAGLYNTEFDTSKLQAVEAAQRLCSMLGMRVASLQPREFFLLREEARHMGIRVGAAQARQRLVDLFAEKTDETVSQLLRNFRLSQEGLFSLMADGMAVEQCVMLQGLGAADSVPRMRYRYRDQNQQALFRVSAIDAAALVSQAPEPTDAELQAFFEQHRDATPTTGGKELSFGYRLPDRVRIEYLTIAPEEVKNFRLRATDVQKFFEENRTRYMKSVAPASAATSEPANPEQVPMTFEEAESRVREDCRQAKSIDEAQKILNDLRAEAYAPWFAQPIAENGYRKAPDNQITLEQIRDKHSSKHPLQYGATELASAEDLRTLFPRPPVYKAGSTTLPLTTYALHVEGLFNPESDRNSESLAVGEPSQILLTTNFVQGKSVAYQPYLFRVIEVAPAGPPTEIGPLKETVRRDLKLKRAFDQAQAAAESLAAKAREAGLTEAVQGASELKRLLGEPAPDPSGSQPALTPEAQQALAALTPVEPIGRFTRQMPTMPGLGRVGHAADLIFGLASSTDAHKVAVIPVPDVKKWAVVELESVQPLYEGEFDAARPSLHDRFGPLIVQMELMKPENVASRAGYKDAIAGGDGEASQ